jgi:hypothetical protein
LLVASRSFRRRLHAAQRITFSFLSVCWLVARCVRDLRGLLASKLHNFHTIHTHFVVFLRPIANHIGSYLCIGSQLFNELGYRFTIALNRLTLDTRSGVDFKNVRPSLLFIPNDIHSAEVEAKCHDSIDRLFLGVFG